MSNLVHHIFSPENGLTEALTFQRGDLMTATGSVEHYIYFIISGAVRIVYRSESEEHTIRLGYKNSIISSLPSFFDATPSLFDIEVIRKCNILRVKKSDYLNCIGNSTELLHSHHKLIEELISQQIDREIDLLTSSPKERLTRLINRSPQVFQEIPHKYIAQYLRMTPETLSRLKS
jgi:CRP-like cAMP-binding protein